MIVVDSEDVKGNMWATLKEGEEVNMVKMRRGLIVTKHGEPDLGRKKDRGMNQHFPYA